MSKDRVAEVDTDFEHTGREAVIEYIKQKYGPDHVCHIITFGTEAARMVVKDVGRVLGYPAAFCNVLAKKIPQEPHMTISKALEDSVEFKSEYDKDNDTRKLVDLAMKLEGCKRHASQHACGLVISPSIVSDFLPTAMLKNDETGEIDVTSQVVAPEVEELSLLKMDLLGLKNMTVIHESVDAINEKYNMKLDYHDIPLDDRETLQFLAKGYTGGVFQLESEGMTKVVTRMLTDIDDLPDSELHQGFERIIAAVALYRPGPMAFIDDYIDGMRDQSRIHYDCPEIESILKSTYGQIVYQEQVMQTVQKLAGYTLGRADLVRKAMGKKKQDIMDQERNVFIYGNKKEFDEGKDANYAPGCVANGISEEVATIVWNKMADFAKYAFNRSHAACYAYIAMITAWLSCHYPKEFYAAMLNAFNDNRDKFKSYLAQANRRGLKMLPPDVNSSREGFFVEDDAIRFSLRGLKGMNKSAGEIIAEREANGKFRSFQDFYDRMVHAQTPIDKKPFESLVYSGALDGFGHARRSLIEAFPKFAQNAKFEKKTMEGQVSLFGMLEDDEAEKYDAIEIAVFPEYDDRRLMEQENEMVGFYLTKHPVDKYDAALNGTKGYASISEMLDQKLFGQVTTVGMVKNLRTVVTRNEEMMCIFTLESRYESVPCVVFPRDMAGNQDAIIENQIIMVKGNFTENDRGMQIVVKTVLREDMIRQACCFDIVVCVTNASEQKELFDWADKNPGEFNLVLLGPDKRIRIG